MVLAAGGFQANAEMRTRYLGPGWELAKVRGTRFNTGDGIRMALDIGAQPTGNWSGSHAVGWDRNAPEFGDLEVGDNFQKHNYPFSIMLNANGERFVDEGADFRNYTYAKYGRIILSQPMQFAWQMFDSKVLHLLRDEYRIKRVTKVRADTLEELVQKLDDVNPEKALATIKAYNAAVKKDVPFNPNVKDGRGTVGLAIPKSNWSNILDTPPYRGLRRHLRHHLHLRRPEDRQLGARDRHRRPGDPRPVRGRRAGRRPVLFQLSGRHRPDERRRVRQDRRHHRRPARRPGAMSARAGQLRRPSTTSSWSAAAARASPRPSRRAPPAARSP